VNATAEQLPFDDNSFDAAMATVTVHQWRDLARGLSELRRVARGPVVILTFDGDALDRFWLAAYAPELIAAERRRYPAIPLLADAIGRSSSVAEVPIPIDCVDGFTEAFYARPESFLDPRVRAAQSAWGFITPEATQRTVAGLRQDLASGRWDETYASWRAQPQFNGSLRLLTGLP
jgi:SAM-dependent methyltransferase